MKHLLILFCICLFCINISIAQNARFPTSGVIEFEKTVNMHAIMKRQLKEQTSAAGNFYSEDFMKYMPQFKKSASTLTFSNTQTLFIPETGSMNDFYEGGAQTNTVFNNLASGIAITQKNLFGENFLLTDSIRKINWKLTSEMRTIAGYECRRANALIMDSIYVVAFYTDKIPVSGGPESFSGLPGMILGIALPHDNTTWFAKTVTDKAVATTAFKVPSKGKPVNTVGLKAVIDELSKKFNGLPGHISRLLML